MNNSQTKSSGYNKMQRRLIVSMSFYGSLWLTLVRCPALSGSLWPSLPVSGSLCLTLALSGSLSGSLWLTLAHSGSLPDSLWLPLALSGSLRLSLALYCSPNLLTKPLLGSQGPCSARNAVPEFPHFNQPCTVRMKLRYYDCKLCDNIYTSKQGSGKHMSCII